MYPTIIEIGWFQVSSFGVMVALGFLVGGWIAARAFEEMGLGGENAWNVLTWCVIGGLLGSKLWYVGENLARHSDAVFSELLFSRGGLTWYGGLLGGAIGGLFQAWRLEIPLVAAMNGSAATLAIGQALGRVGCFLVGDDYGRPTDGPFGIAFPQGLPPTEIPVHPTMLYEVAWLVPAGAILWARRSRSPFLFGEYLMFAGAGRLWIEGLRINPTLIGPLTNAQLVALGCLIVGFASWMIFYRKRTAELSSSAPA
ncbi:MAG: prolipoprotein diacylglyceryl transferase [bacterium]|nr:prolipoprotein diacylglyceryl transferase [bacterium]